MLLMGKPFNPILGETFQMRAKNSLYFVEQTCHHPPIHNYYIVNPKFKMYGYLKLDAFAIPTKANIYFGGKCTIEFNDGNKYQVRLPGLESSGMLIGTRYMNFAGSLKIEDMVII